MKAFEEKQRNMSATPSPEGGNSPEEGHDPPDEGYDIPAELAYTNHPPPPRRYSSAAEEEVRTRVN